MRDPGNGVESRKALMTDSHMTDSHIKISTYTNTHKSRPRFEPKKTTQTIQRYLIGRSLGTIFPAQETSNQRHFTNLCSATSSEWNALHSASNLC